MEFAAQVCQTFDGFFTDKYWELIRALYGIEEGISRGSWSDSSLSDSKGKIPLGGQRCGDVGTISTIGLTI